MNFSFANFFVGLIGLAAGFGILKEAFYLNHHILFLGWAEQKWGPGYGTTAYRWIGIAIMIFSMFVMLGVVNMFTDPSSVLSGGIGAKNQKLQPTIQAPTGTSNIAP